MTYLPQRIAKFLSLRLQPVLCYLYNKAYPDEPQCQQIIFHCPLTAEQRAEELRKRREEYLKYEAGPDTAKAFFQREPTSWEKSTMPNSQKDVRTAFEEANRDWIAQRAAAAHQFYDQQYPNGIPVGSYPQPLASPAMEVNFLADREGD